MDIFLWIIGTLVFTCLLALRITAVYNAYRDWNYFIYRFQTYKLMAESDVTMGDIEKNIVRPAEIWFVVIMFWKVIPERFFDYKPDWFEINEKYYLKKV